MKRQLRMGGGIMDVVPRDKFFLGKVAKAVKKPVKKNKVIASFVLRDKKKNKILTLSDILKMGDI